MTPKTREWLELRRRYVEHAAKCEDPCCALGLLALIALSDTQTAAASEVLDNEAGVPPTPSPEGLPSVGDA
jgi:hypothetical protein